MGGMLQIGKEKLDLCEFKVFITMLKLNCIEITYTQKPENVIFFNR